MLGLCVFGAGEGMIVEAGLGNSPWTVFAQGVSVQTPLSIGTATILISGLVLLAWIPLRQRPGLGTISNAIVIGLALDATVALVPDGGNVAGQIGELALGLLLVAVGSGLYLGSALGPGPRDGLMTGLHRVTGASIRLVRTLLELSAFTAGVILGGDAGVGTLVFALSMGPLVAAALAIGGVERPSEL
jgi:uncharacterized membrane protein YczE